MSETIRGAASAADRAEAGSQPSTNSSESGQARSEQNEEVRKPESEDQAAKSADRGGKSGSSDGAAGVASKPGPAGSSNRRRRRGGRGRGRGGRGGGGRSGGGAQGTQGAQGGAADKGGPAQRRDGESESGASEPKSDPKSSDAGSRGDDYTDAAADRGLTSDDVAAKAREEATEPSPAKPKIGDTRPAPKPQGGTPTSGSTSAAEQRSGDAPKKRRRRRRGGRGRSSQSSTSQPGAPTDTQNKSAQPIVDGMIGAGDVDVDGTAILESLDEATLERRMGSTRKGRPAGRYLTVVHVHDDQIAQISVLEGRNLVEHFVSRPTDDTMTIDGNIYLGRVQNVLPGMEAAFVDIGTPKNAVLYRSDVAYDAEEYEGQGPPKIESMLKNGQSILVQVTKNPIGHKGARLTQEVSLAGRFVVMVPNQPKTYGISKRLPDDERRRLRRVLDRVRPDDAGLIVRTAAEGATEDELRHDMMRLTDQWNQINSLRKRAKAGSLLYREPQLVVRLVREEFTKEHRGIVIDDAKLYEEVRGYISAVAPELADRVEYYDTNAEDLPILERFHIHEQLVKALDRKVWLPSGGSLVIEHTEALTVIDVNTAKNVGRSSLEETVYQNNLEAADAVARELRLRDIGGIIVIDFIDMAIESNRRDVERAFREALARDKTRTQVFPISELGLVEMTRKRIGEGIVDTMARRCETCNAHGYIVDETLLL